MENLYESLNHLHEYRWGYSMSNKFYLIYDLLTITFLWRKHAKMHVHAANLFVLVHVFLLKSIFFHQKIKDLLIN